MVSRTSDRRDELGRLAQAVSGSVGSQSTATNVPALRVGIGPGDRIFLKVQVLAQVERGEVTTPQRDECRQSDDQAVAVLDGIASTVRSSVATWAETKREFEWQREHCFGRLV
jgi:hypothetical protein